jgi:inner membrane protein
MALGAFQQQRALDVQRAIAEARGHHVERGAVFPSFANNVAWRSLYQSEGRYYVDKLRVPWSGRNCASPGVSVPVARTVPVAGVVEQRAQRLFRWFSDDWVAYDPSDAGLLGDLRYSFSPQEATPIWGIRVEGGQVEWVNQRQRREIRFSDLSDLILRDSPDALCF